MQRLFCILLFPLTLLGGTYMVPSTPLETITITSETTGKVIHVEHAQEHHLLDHTKVVQLDDSLEKQHVAFLREQIAQVEKIVALKKENARNKSQVTRLSQYDKNQEQIDYLESAKELSNLRLTLAQVLDAQQKKAFYVHERYLHRLHVNKDERLHIGEKVMTLLDTSGVKLTAFIAKEDIASLREGKVLFNGQKGVFKVHSIDTVRDTTHLSAYRVEFRRPLQEAYLFGELVRIEVLP